MNPDCVRQHKAAREETFDLRVAGFGRRDGENPRAE